MNDFDLKIRDNHPGGLLSEDIGTLQINLGRYCNLSCSHCHLECSSTRTEQMPRDVMESILSLTDTSTFRLIDITGGSPELHPQFQDFLERLCAKGQPVQVRTNLTTFLEPAMRGMVLFFKRHRVSLVGSLPCYLEENVDAQRGAGVHKRSVAAIRLLNKAGYGIEDGLALNLAFNPGGPFLPPMQSELENIYREELKEHFGIEFTRLIVLTNMPLGRFGKRLEHDHEMDGYLKTLKDAFNPATLPHLMCRHQISVDWDGTVYDCDFNLALGMAVNHGASSRIERLDLEQSARRRIMTGIHCFGCTAGAGSSCSGTLASVSCAS